MGNEFSSLFAPLPRQQPRPRSKEQYRWFEDFKCMIYDTSFFGPPPPLEAKAVFVFNYMRNVYTILLQMIHEHVPELQEHGIQRDTLHINDFEFYVNPGDEIMKHEAHWKNYENALQFRDLRTLPRNSQTHPTSTTNLHPQLVRDFHHQMIASRPQDTPKMPVVISVSKPRSHLPEPEVSSQLKLKPQPPDHYVDNTSGQGNIHQFHNNPLPPPKKPAIVPVVKPSQYHLDPLHQALLEQTVNHQGNSEIPHYTSVPGNRDMYPRNEISLQSWMQRLKPPLLQPSSIPPNSDLSSPQPLFHQAHPNIDAMSREHPLAMEGGSAHLDAYSVPDVMYISADSRAGIAT